MASGEETEKLYPPRAVTQDILPHASQWARALSDISGASKQFNLLIVLGMTDIVSRYRRSGLGQFWMTLSNAILIVAIGLVWANIWKMPLNEFLPYMAAGHVFWLLMTSTLVDATNTFAQSASYMKELCLPRSTYIFSNAIKNLVIFGHNALIVPVIYAYFGVWPTTYLLLLIPALVLTVLTLLAVSFWLAVIGLRFRDIPNLVSSLVTVLFFLTPVIWKQELLDDHLRSLLVYNPFHIFLELLRAPLLGYAPATEYWWLAIYILVVNLCLGFLVFARWRRWVTYWL